MLDSTTVPIVHWGEFQQSRKEQPLGRTLWFKNGCRLVARHRFPWTPLVWAAYAKLGVPEESKANYEK
ncbi:MAG: hypothetical protein AAB254_11140, partial [candidate division NC10 bacterium]